MFFILHLLIVFIGLFVDASISSKVVSPVNDYTMFAPQFIEMVLLVPLTIDFALRMFAPTDLLRQVTGKSEKIKEIVHYVVLILFWFISWFMMNAVLRGYLRMRSTLYFGRIFEGFYIILRKKNAGSRESKA